jgi:uncharacterized lipoprotein YmbA
MSLTGRLGTLLCILAAGCATTPPARLYSLSASATAAFISSDLSVSVGPVSIPAAVDRPQIVVATAANHVQLEDFNRWASPLQENLSSVIAQNLAALLGSSRVTRFPKTSSADADFRVAIEVTRFESVPGQWATLDAAWTVRRTVDGVAQTQRTSVREPVHDNSFESLAAAHSRAAARLSQDIAGAIRGMIELARQ